MNMWQRIKDLANKIGRIQYPDHIDDDGYIKYDIASTHTHQCVDTHTTYNDDEIVCSYDINDYDDVEHDDHIDDINQAERNLTISSITSNIAIVQRHRRTPWYRARRAHTPTTTSGLITRRYLGICQHHNYLNIRSVAPLTQWPCATCGEDMRLWLIPSDRHE